MKTHTRTLAAALILAIFAVLASLYLGACAAIPRARIIHDGKAVLRAYEKAAGQWTIDQAARLSD